MSQKVVSVGQAYDVTYGIKNWWWLHLFITLHIWIYFTTEVNINFSSKWIYIRLKGVAVHLVECLHASFTKKLHTLTYTYICVLYKCRIYRSLLSYYSFLSVSHYSPMTVIAYTLSNFCIYILIFLYFIFSNDWRDKKKSCDLTGMKWKYAIFCTVIAGFYFIKYCVC